MMNMSIPSSLMDNKEYVSNIIRKGFVPTDRNFLPFSYGMNEAVFGSIVGVKPMYVFIQEDTSNMLVREILELEEQIIVNKDKDKIVVVNQQEKDKYMEASRAIYNLLDEKEFNTDSERINYLLDEYPKLKEWSMNDKIMD